MFSSSPKETPVTVGLCVKNSERTIRACLMSILKQQYPARLVDIIVVDGKSTDKTIPLAKKIISLADVSARFYSDGGKGLGQARQIVLSNTEKKYVIWVDGDVAIAADFIKTQVEFMENNPKVAVAAGMYFFKRDTHMALPALLQSLDKLVGSTQFKETRALHGLPPNDASVYRVEISRKVGGFDTRITGAAEDEEIILRMRRIGWFISVNPDAKYYALTRRTWHDVWKEASWFGYGQHFLGHKYADLHVCMYSIPLVHGYIGIKVSFKAYRLTSQTKSFLLPFASVFFTIGWWFGFIKANLEGYGHDQS